MSIRIDVDRCIGCGSCVEACPGNLIKRDAKGKSVVKRPADCWGCASCLKECRFGAITYYLGADLGGRGALMHVERDGDVARWIITRDGDDPVTISVDRRNANRY